MRRETPQEGGGRAMCSLTAALVPSLLFKFSQNDTRTGAFVLDLGNLCEFSLIYSGLRLSKCGTTA